MLRHLLVVRLDRLVPPLKAMTQSVQDGSVAETQVDIGTDERHEVRTLTAELERRA